MANDASMSMDALRLSETSPPGQAGEEWRRRQWIADRLMIENRETSEPEAERKSIADKIWAWEQEQFPVRGPRLRLPGRGFRPHLVISKILAWADAHYARTGHWPTAKSGLVRAAPHDETWGAIQSALNQGRRGLPGGSSLGQLLAECRDVKPALTVERIIAWADDYYASQGRWPTRLSGSIPGVYRETWGNLDDDLRVGRRGLPGGSTLARELAAHRGVRNVHTIRPLSLELILAWADAHRRCGRWPSVDSGPVHGARGESWSAINSALTEGRRGLPGASTLVRVLVANRGRPAVNGRSELTVEQILAWADAHHAAHGRWPVEGSGAVEGAPGESWGAISLSLQHGRRGLTTAGSSLARLLAEHRGARNPKALPHLTLIQILAWADAHYAAHGQWPSGRSGSVSEAAGEDWKNIDMALRKGLRGLPGNSSLAKLLTQRRPEQRGRLTMAKVRMWADFHRQATGRWPDGCAGPVAGVPGEDWHSIDQALRHGRRGLPAGASLRALFGRSQDPAALGTRPPLTLEQILAWGDAYHAAHGRWPNRNSGPILGAPGEKWVNLDMALRHGRRGLPSGLALAVVFAQYRDAAPTAAMQAATAEDLR